MPNLRRYVNLRCDMKYELLAIIPAQYSETELPGIFSNLSDAVKEAGAEVISQEDKGKEKLAYSVGQVKFGHLSLIRFEAEPAVAKKLGEQLRLRNDLIRYMITKVVSRAAPKPRIGGETARKEPVFAPVSGEETATAKKEEKVTLEDLDRKLDEILGKETI